MKIIVTAVGSMPRISLINELRAKGHYVVGIDCNPLSVGFNFCNKHYIVPKANDDNFINELSKICEKERINTIIISPDEELIRISHYRNYFDLTHKVKLLIPSHVSVRTCLDKWLTYQFFTKNNIPTPDTELYNNENIIYPALLKPRQGRGGLGIIKINYRDNIKRYLKDYIIQEFIEGTEYSIDVLSDWKSNPISIVIRERIQVESGISTKARVIYDKEIENYIKKIVKKLKLIGMSCIQCIRGKKGIKFTEINLRFGGGSVLSRKADSTILENYLRLIEGKKLLKPKKSKQLTMMRYYKEIIV